MTGMLSHVTGEENTSAPVEAPPPYSGAFPSQSLSNLIHHSVATQRSRSSGHVSSPRASRAGNRAYTIGPKPHYSELQRPAPGTRIQGFYVVAIGQT
ncbi:hypothetical protein DXG01_014504, partial [Tephrocybe rancida]